MFKVGDKNKRKTFKVGDSVIRIVSDDCYIITEVDGIDVPGYSSELVKVNGGEYWWFAVAFRLDNSRTEKIKKLKRKILIKKLLKPWTIKKVIV